MAICLSRRVIECESAFLVQSEDLAKILMNYILLLIVPASSRKSRNRQKTGGGDRLMA